VQNIGKSNQYEESGRVNIAAETAEATAVRAALDSLEETGMAKNTATLGLISRLCDELLERRASA
jgi:hypothetical protein